MTIHSNYDSRCICGYPFISYEPGVHCPGCGTESKKDDSGFINEAIESLRHNKVIFRSYLPGAWIEMTSGDQVLWVIFNIFEDPEVLTKDPFPTEEELKYFKGLYDRIKEKMGEVEIQTIAPEDWLSRD